MADWKSRLLRMGQEEHRREQEHRKAADTEAETLRRFIAGVAQTALTEVAAACTLINRSTKLGAPDNKGITLITVRDGRDELSFEIKAMSLRYASLEVRNRQSSDYDTLAFIHLLADRETVKDLTVERVRDAVVKQLERRLKGEI